MEIPTEKLLDRDLSRTAVESYRKNAAPALAAVVDYGVAAFERCSASAKGSDENMGILFPALHVFEMLDGVEILLREGAVVPTRPLLRSAFEAKLIVEYVTEDESSERGAAYVVEEIHRRIKSLERFDPATDIGKSFQAEFAGDRIGAAISIPVVHDIKQRIASLQKLLDKSHLRAAAAEYVALKKKGRVPPFYGFWGGPRTVEQLARHLKRGGQYEILYRTWSRTAHGLDLERQLTGNDGQAAVRVFRDPSDIATAYSLAISFGLETIRAILSHYRPDELAGGSFARWYANTVQPAYMALPTKPEAGSSGSPANPAT
jgi:hypothetical protein